MSADPTSIDEPPRELATSKGKVCFWLFALVVLVVAIRAVSEVSMMSAHGSDPQMAIWIGFMVVSVCGVSLMGLTLAAAVYILWPSRVAALPIVVLAMWAAWIGLASANFYLGGQALRLAESAHASAEQLDRLVDFDGIQAGYELDNRIAANSNTSTDSLRRLYERNNLGTNMVLARNPATPIEILEELAKSDEKWITESLKRNPSLANAQSVTSEP